MKMVSYWKETKQFYDEDGELFQIYGYYDHLNQSGGICDKNRRIGIYWRDDYPSSRGYLSPCVIPEHTAMCLLKGLFEEMLLIGETEKADKISEAIRFMRGMKQ